MGSGDRKLAEIATDFFKVLVEHDTKSELVRVFTARVANVWKSTPSLCTVSEAINSQSRDKIIYIGCELNRFLNETASDLRYG